jgi:hypothetical protein
MSYSPFEKTLASIGEPRSPAVLSPEECLEREAFLDLVSGLLQVRVLGAPTPTALTFAMCVLEKGVSPHRIGPLTSRPPPPLLPTLGKTFCPSPWCIHHCVPHPLPVAQVDPLKRWSPKQCLLHPFVTGAPVQGFLMPPDATHMR